MTGADVAKQLSLACAIVFVVGLGMMLLPTEARYLRAGYSLAAAFIVGGHLVVMKPRVSWVRSTLIFLGSSFAIIGLILAFGG